MVTDRANRPVLLCTLEAGVDYDQTFAKTLSHHSARGLFAYAAWHACRPPSLRAAASSLLRSALAAPAISAVTKSASLA